VLIGFSTDLDSFWQRIFGERITTTSLHQFQFRLDQWMIRHREGQPRVMIVFESASPETLTSLQKLPAPKGRFGASCGSIKRFLPTDLKSFESAESARLLVRFYPLPATGKLWFTRRP
jgi:hypothetical protein